MFIVDTSIERIFET